MTSGSRLPTWKERENNRRRERRRRAIAAKIYAGLRAYGNYKLPKHCDNNEVLKALCFEAGWIVEEDGLTYKKGMKPPARTPETGFAPSPFMSPASSSYPSPASSACPSPVRTAPYGGAGTSSLTPPHPGGETLIPWLKGLSSSSSSSARLLSYGGGSSYSAPVTPPLSSPTCLSPRSRDKTNGHVQWETKPANSIKDHHHYHHSMGANTNVSHNNVPADCAATALLNAWSSSNSNTVLGARPRGTTNATASSCPPSPLLRAASHERCRGSGASSATIMASSNPSGVSSPVIPAATVGGGSSSSNGGGVWMAPWIANAAGSSSFSSSSLWRPGYSYISPPASACTIADPASSDPYPDASCSKEVVSDPVVKAWAGEQIHEECPTDDSLPLIGPQDLELKL